MSGRHGIQEDFCCLKCRNHEARIQIVSLPKGTFVDLLGLNTGARYRFVTCSLCGYTEIFDLAIMDRSGATQAEDAATPEAGQEA